MTPFSAIITPNSVSFTTQDGKSHNIQSDHTNYENIREAIKGYQRAVKDGDAETAEKCHASLTDLTDIAQVVNDAGQGKVRVLDGAVYYGDEEIHNAITTRILWGLKEGFDMDPYIAFLDNALLNPSKHALDEMYGFMEANGMGITDDGYIIGYKKVRDNFHDIYTGKFDNSPGKVLEMRRNKVDDNRHRTCSSGFHFCSMSYLPHFGASEGHRIVLVKVNPRDVVSVPVDYNNAKVRCCRYEVIAEYTGSDRDDLLGSKAVWTDEDFAEPEFDEEEDDWSGWSSDDEINADDEDEKLRYADMYIGQAVAIKIVGGGVTTFEEDTINKLTPEKAVTDCGMEFDWSSDTNEYVYRSAVTAFRYTLVSMDDEEAEKFFFDEQADQSKDELDLGDIDSVEEALVEGLMEEIHQNGADSGGASLFRTEDDIENEREAARSDLLNDITRMSAKMGSVVDENTKRVQEQIEHLQNLLVRADGLANSLTNDDIGSIVATTKLVEKFVEKATAAKIKSAADDRLEEALGIRVAGLSDWAKDILRDRIEIEGGVPTSFIDVWENDAKTLRKIIDSQIVKTIDTVPNHNDTMAKLAKLVMKVDDAREDHQKANRAALEEHIKAGGSNVGWAPPEFDLDKYLLVLAEVGELKTAPEEVSISTDESEDEG